MAARRLLRSPSDVRWLSAQIGNRQTARLLARETTDASPREPGSGRVLPRIRIERDPKLANRLRFLYGGEIVGTLDVTGAGKDLENLQLRDFTQNREGDISTLDIEVRHPPGAKLKWDVWRHSIAKTKTRYGVGAVNVKLVELKPPYRRDPEIQVWPPLDYKLSGIDRPQVTERERKESEERRRWEQEEQSKAVKLLALLESELERDYAHYEDVQSGGAAGVVSELLGDARYPMPDEWNQAYAYLFEAQKAVDRGDSRGARAWIRRADAAREAMAARVAAFETDRETGAGRAVKGLSVVAVVGETAARLIPGPLGKVLSFGYEVAKPAPKTLEEAADRLRGAYGTAGGPQYPTTPGRIPAAGKTPSPGTPPKPKPAAKSAPTTTPPHSDAPAPVRPPAEPDPPAVKAPPKPEPPAANAGAAGSKPPPSPPPRRQQQQQHQQPGQRIGQGGQTTEQKPQPNRPRQQQQQHQQQQTGPAPPRAAAAPSLLQRAKTAGAADEIDGPMEVFAYGTTLDVARKTVEAAQLPTGGGNFGGRRFMATNVETARIFAARRVTNVDMDKVRDPAEARPGIVGVAMPKATADALKKRGVLRYDQMTDPPPELANSRGQWTLDPAGVEAINLDGFFFLID